nr:RHOMBOID-like protein 10, chloroplastic [Ipomoea batatas]
MSVLDRSEASSSAASPALPRDSASVSIVMSLETETELGEVTDVDKNPESAAAKALSIEEARFLFTSGEFFEGPTSSSFPCLSEEYLSLVRLAPDLDNCRRVGTSIAIRELWAELSTGVDNLLLISQGPESSEGGLTITGDFGIESGSIGESEDSNVTALSREPSKRKVFPYERQGARDHSTIALQAVTVSTLTRARSHSCFILHYDMIKAKQVHQQEISVTKIDLHWNVAKLISQMKTSPQTEPIQAVIFSGFKGHPPSSAATPNPSGTSDIENTTTPSCSLTFSVILPTPPFNTLFPYRKLISDVGFSQTLCFACAAIKFSDWIVRSPEGSNCRGMVGSAAVPSNPKFPAPIPRRLDLTTAHLITNAAALRLGNSLCRRLRLSCLLRSSFKNICHHAGAPTFTALQLDGFDLLDWSRDVLSTACMSFSFISGGGSRKDSKGFGKSYSNSSRHFISNDRKWTNLLLAINILAYIAQIGTKGQLLFLGAKVNCYSLNSVGPAIEKISGPRRYIAVYLISAIASSTFSYWHSKAPAVGASGAIFGLVGSFAVFVLRHRGTVKGTEGDLVYIARIIALNMAIGFLSKGIDNWGHLGGLVGGAATSWLVGPAWKLESVSEGRRVFADKAPIFSLIKSRKTKP